MITQNPQTLKVIKNLNSAHKQLTDSFKILDSQVLSKLELLIEQYTAKEQELADLDIIFKEKYRQAKLDLDLNIKEDKTLALNALAKDLGFTLIASKAYQDLQTRLQIAESDRESEILAARKEEESKSNSKLGAIKRNMELEHKAASAELTAQLNVAKDQVAFLDKQLEDLRNQAATQLEKAAAIAGASATSVNIPNK